MRHILHRNSGNIRANNVPHYFSLHHRAILRRKAAVRVLAFAHWTPLQEIEEGDVPLLQQVQILQVFAVRRALHSSVGDRSAHGCPILASAPDFLFFSRRNLLRRNSPRRLERGAGSGQKAAEKNAPACRKVSRPIHGGASFLPVVHGPPVRLLPLTTASSKISKKIVVLVPPATIRGMEPLPFICLPCQRRIPRFKALSCMCAYRNILHFVQVLLPGARRPPLSAADRRQLR